MIINNNVSFGYDMTFEIESADDKVTHLELSTDRYAELSGESLPGNPPYTVKAQGGCGSAELNGVGVHDIVTYYQGFDRDTEKGQNKLAASTDIG